MSLVRSGPALRWLAPSVAAVVVIAGGAAAGTIVASADSPLPERSAAQLLADLEQADVAGFSGVVVQSSDLGIPALGAFAKGVRQDRRSGAADLVGLFMGSSTARVWQAGEDRARVALLGTRGETDLIRNGPDVWMWNSIENDTVHLRLAPGERPPQVPPTPAEVADAALAAIGPATEVQTTGAARVAGRDAYELVLSPKDAASLIGQIRLAIDAETHLPLRVEVYATNATDPAFRVTFQQISYAVPDAQQFAFNPPPGTTVAEVGSGDVARRYRAMLARELAGDPVGVGGGWTAVIKARLSRADSAGRRRWDASLDSLPKVGGSWGSGRLFEGALFSVLVTDDGRLFAGAVTPARLYEVAG